MDTNKVEQKTFSSSKQEIVYDETFANELQEFVKSRLSPERYEHSVRVAQTAQMLCKKYDYDPVKGYIAGIAHDLAKELKNSPEYEEYCVSLRSKMQISSIEEKNIGLLHGKVASEILAKKFNVKDKDICQAISHHVLGSPKLGKLGKIIYVADKIEPGRIWYTEQDRQYFFTKNLNELTLLVLNKTLGFLKENGNEVAPISAKFQTTLGKTIENEISFTKQNSVEVNELKANKKDSVVYF